MRGGRVLVIVVLALGGVGMPRGASAAATVDVMSNLFSPEISRLAPGEPIQFNWLHGGHSATALDGSFDSGVRGSGSSMSVIFSGGQLRYRCTLHSFLDPAGQCNGMCGEITEASKDFVPPRAGISEPQNDRVVAGRRTIGSLLGSVAFRGSATDDRAVGVVRLRLRRPPTGWMEYSVHCQGCGSVSAYWSTTIGLLPGRYEAQVTASDPSANTGRSGTITFVVV